MPVTSSQRERAPVRPSPKGEESRGEEEEEAETGDAAVDRITAVRGTGMRRRRPDTSTTLARIPRRGCSTYTGSSGSPPSKSARTPSASSAACGAPPWPGPRGPCRPTPETPPAYLVRLLDQGHHHHPLVHDWIYAAKGAPLNDRTPSTSTSPQTRVIELDGGAYCRWQRLCRVECDGAHMGSFVCWICMPHHVGRPTTAPSSLLRGITAVNATISIFFLRWNHFFGGPRTMNVILSSFTGPYSEQ